MMAFAMNPTLPGTAENVLQQIEREAPDLRWVALIDTLADYEKPVFPLPEGSVNCYALPGLLASLTPVAPWLVPLDKKTAPELVPALIAHCSARPMLSFIVLPKNLALEKLVNQWKNLHWVYPEEGEKLLLRFADTRTLAILPKLLTPGQWRAWCENLAQWHFIGRYGRLETLLLPETDIKPEKKLKFDDAQFARMLELNEPDTALGTTLQWHPAALPEEITGYRYYELATGAIEQANRHKIEEWQERFTLIGIAVATDGKTLQSDEMEQWLATHVWEKGKFGNTLGNTPWYRQLVQ